MKAYPDAIDAIDETGCMPFAALVKDWECWLYGVDLSNPDASADSLAEAAASRVASALSHADDAADGSAWAARPSSKEDNKCMRRMYPQVDVWEEVLFCWDMLSLALDELGGKNGGLRKLEKKQRADKSLFKKDKGTQAALVTHMLAEMPTLVKTILLVDDGSSGEARMRLLQSSLFRRMLLCPGSAGKWLIHMLQTKGLPSKKAIDYLVLVSHANVHDYVGKFRAASPEDEEEFESARSQVFHAIDDLRGVVASLAVLSPRETERAASTSVMWFIMNKNLCRPFVVSLVLIDLVLHIKLLLVRGLCCGCWCAILSTFRSIPSCRLFSDIALPFCELMQSFRTSVVLDVNVNSSELAIPVPTQVAYFISAHYLIRKACESLAVLNLSVSVFRRYILNIWNMFDIAAIILTVVAMA